MHCTVPHCSEGLPSAHVATLVALRPCTVHYCTLLYSTVLYCDVLYCTPLLRGAPFSPCGNFGSSGTLYCTLLYSTVLYYCNILYLIALWSSPHHATPKYQISWESVLWFQAFKEFPGIQRVNRLILLIAQIAQSATFSNQDKYPLLSLEMTFQQ